jgi:hypothetical protein
MQYVPLSPTSARIVKAVGLVTATETVEPGEADVPRAPPPMTEIFAEMIPGLAAELKT